MINATSAIFSYYFVISRYLILLIDICKIFITISSNSLMKNRSSNFIAFHLNFIRIGVKHFFFYHGLQNSFVHNNFLMLNYSHNGKSKVLNMLLFFLIYSQIIFSEQFVAMYSLGYLVIPEYHQLLQKLSTQRMH